uniref:Uncharacterized protein n=1 Tax=Brassica oleracea var. oleracea TaxID=109376 RepID=A0A0D3BN53_BRAOL
MGTLVGHVLPGLAFLALGLWHLFNNIKLFCLRPNIFYSSVWFPVSKIRYLELYFIMFSSSASISMELFVGPRKHQPFDSDGTIPSNHLHNFEHSFISMSFLVYAVLALVLDRARPRAAASEGLTILAAAAAFSQELLLFHFHSTDHVGFEGQYHLILQLIIFVSLLTTLMGRCCLAQELFGEPCEIFKYSFSRSVMGTNWSIVQPKKLFTELKRWYVNLEFSCLFVINTICVVTLFFIMDRNYGGNIEYSSLTTNYQRGQYDEEQQHFETQKMSFVQMGKLVDHEDKM